MIRRTSKRIIRNSLRLFNLDLVNYERYKDALQKNNDPRILATRLEFILTRNQIDGIRNSRSQLLQEMFVLSRLDFKTNGFFVEFGAADGVALSNTYLLEKSYGWRGILAEPARCWHTAIRANRDSFIEEACVWKESGSVLSFNETVDHEFSTIEDFSSKDFHHRIRKEGKVYEVASISLVDLLEKYDAPSKIDYLSVDTEGSEYEILRNFDFSRYRFNVITCEHNYTETRHQVFDLLTSHGYRRVFEEVSLWDDWYIQSDQRQ